MDILFNKEEGTCDSVTLKSSDGLAFNVSAYCASKSDYILDKMQGKKEDIELIFPDIEGKILKNISDYLNHFKDDKMIPSVIPKPLKNSKIEDYLTPWEKEYINNISLQDCILLINASNFLGIAPLLKLACARIAAKMIDLSPEEASRAFNIECDMSEEELSRFNKYILRTPEQIQNNQYI